MALINRISRLFKADFHAVLDQIEEPEALLKQAIRDMEDDMASAEQRIHLCAHDQDALTQRKSELETTIAEIEVQLDLCFESDKDDLARNVIRKKLEAERLLRAGGVVAVPTETVYGLAANAFDPAAVLQEVEDLIEDALGLDDNNALPIDDQMFRRHRIDDRGL